MHFVSVPYLRWAKTAGEGCELFLSWSGMNPPPTEWLGSPSVADALNFKETYGDPPVCLAIAQRYGARPEQVLTTQGASEANFLILATLIQRGDRVAVEVPGYEPLWRVVEALGGEVVPLPRPYSQKFSLDLEGVERLLAEGVRLFVVTDLHNPSGMLLDRPLLAALAARIAEARGWLLVDEVYLDFMFERRPPGAFLLNERVITTSSLTKVYGLGALRAGWALGHPDLIARAYQVRDHLEVVGSGPSAVFARTAFQVLERLAAWSAWKAAAGRAVMDRFMANTDWLQWVPPDGGIVGLVKLPEGMSDRRFSEYLARQHRVLVTPGSFFQAPGFLRLGFGGDPSDLEEGLSRLVQGLLGFGLSRNPLTAD